MQEKVKIISENRKARHDYFLENSIECGIVLQGTEIKAMRCHSVNISDSYVIIRNGEAYILNMDIQVTDGFEAFKECVLNAIKKEQDK